MSDPLWRRGLLGSAVVKLIAAHLGAILLGVVLVFGGVFLATSQQLLDQLHEAVEADKRALLKDYRDLGPFGLSLSIRNRLPVDRGGEVVYQLISPTGVKIVGNIRKTPSLPADGRIRPLELSLTDGRSDAPVEMLALTLSGRETLYVGRVSGAVRSFDAALLRSTLISAVLIGALSLVVALSIVRLLRRRLAALALTAEEIMAGDLGRRMSVSSAEDEFDQVSLRLNAMLDRISDLIGDLRMVTDSVAHDLRSPLTRLRGHLEQALSQDALQPGSEAEDARADILKAMAEADGALTAFASLIAIARAEAGVGRDQFERVCVSDLLFELAALYEPTAEDGGVTLEATAAEGLMAQGHRQLLAQAITNLIENALKFAPKGSVIRLVAREGADGAIIVSVADQGEGIAPEDRERALRRFERLDPGRGGAGFGLGLALAAAVARLHGGSLRLEDAEPRNGAPGLKASLIWPGS